MEWQIKKKREKYNMSHIIFFSYWPAVSTASPEKQKESR